MSDYDLKIPSEIKEVMDLYQERLAAVRFPGVDRETLEAQLAAAAGRHAAVEAARAELDRSRTELDEALEALRRSARRAYDYALVYAADEPELALELEGFEMKQPPPAPRPRRSKGAKKKGAERTPQLALAGEGKGPAAADDSALDLAG